MLKFFASLVILSALVLMAPALPGQAGALAASGNTATPSINDSPDILVTPVQGPSVSQRLDARARTSWPWYITRASGLVAALALVILLLSGVGLITGYTFNFLEPLTAWATHKAIGVVFIVSSVVHIGALLLDKYVPFNLMQALVPFASHYNEVTVGGYNLGSLYVAFGVITIYLGLAILISTWLWIDKKPYIWKAIHFMAYLIMIMIFFHALFLGTDLAHGTLRVIWVVFGIAVGIAILYRVRRAGSA